jgi:hypothetical protein
MLAEIYLLKLEAGVSAAKEAATTGPTSHFVPVTLPLPRHPSRLLHRRLISATTACGHRYDQCPAAHCAGH